MKYILIIGLFVIIGSVAQAKSVWKKDSKVLTPRISNEFVNSYEVDIQDGYVEIEVSSKNEANKESAGIISVRIIRNNFKDQTESESKESLLFKINGESIFCKID